jgi:hypothetical protein
MNAEVRTWQIRVWLALAVVALAAGAVAYVQRPATEPEVRPRPKPNVLYGTLLAPGNVCTEGSASPAGWLCLVSIASSDAGVIELRPYRGTCGHVVADQEHGRWICRAPQPAPAAPWSSL